MDEAFGVFGIGGGAASSSGVYVNAPPLGLTPFYDYPLMAALNQPGSATPVKYPVTVHFPAAGIYPFEIDFFGGSGEQLSLSLSQEQNTGGSVVDAPLPPIGTVTIARSAPELEIGGSASVIVSVRNGLGEPAADAEVTVSVSGPNPSRVTGLTDENGTAVLTYTGMTTGIDTVQAEVLLNGLASASNVVSIIWSDGPPGPAMSEFSPADGTIVTKPMPITAIVLPPEGETISTWSVHYQDTHGGAPQLIASGAGAPPEVLGTFDPTMLPNDAYQLRVGTGICSKQAANRLRFSR